MNKRVGIVGSNGFIGKNLKLFLSEKGYNVLPIDRSLPIDTIKECDIIINLAGRSIDCRWNKKNKEEILNSRIVTTRNLINIINSLNKPIFLINASAIGIYKNSNEYIHTESSDNFDSGFLSKVCQEWEQQANRINDRNNLCITRFGVVFSKSGGAFKKMTLSMIIRFFPILGDGEQYISWIGLNDLSEAIDFIISNKISGTINITTPTPLTYKHLSEHLSKYKKNISLKIPKFIIRLLLGESSEMVLNSHYIVPQTLLELNFKFNESNIDSIIRS